jgi:hypothetical protein
MIGYIRTKDLVYHAVFIISYLGFWKWVKSFSVAYRGGTFLELIRKEEK